MTLYAALFLSLVYLTLSNAACVSAAPFSISDRKMVSIEYLTPTENDRDIRTTNIDVYYYLNDVEHINLSISWGLAVTYASGNITQLEGSIAGGNLREVRYENSAVGIGPGLLASFQLWSNEKFSFHLNGSGNFIVYNRRFPAGGDYYNFMWRGGPSFKYNIDNSKAVDIGYHWAHVSNGQGVGPKNPSYEAKGVILRFVGFF